ncbi:hypothetical protein EL26_11305 [Tumebacillus flagellatus]|uniref:MalT-like TPR region domain-containing protein n=2 Tax=Tumebacillus flagellatus TaxID=1157490 RepID=A0A074LQ88_9BACL|nr:hypothetical protein EL26_11305 [Tumebacillus flagellatus]
MLSELERITNGLHIREERLRRMDTYMKEEELLALLDSKDRTKETLAQALRIANELVEVALGYTEKGYALNNLGRIQYLQRQYDEAHRTWLESMKCAHVIHERFEDNKLLHIVSSNLMLTYIMRKEYSNVEELLATLDQAFPEDAETLGMTSYTRMNMANERGHVHLAKEYAYRSLEFFQRTGNSRQIALSMINAAHFEYRTENYSISAELLSKAIELVQSREETLMIAVKDYVKTLIALGDLHKAERVLCEYETMSWEYPDYWGKLQILKTVVKDDPAYAQNVSDDLRVSKVVRDFSYYCLFEYYDSKGDSEKAISYYKKCHASTDMTYKFLAKEAF